MSSCLASGKWGVPDFDGHDWQLRQGPGLMKVIEVIATKPKGEWNVEPSRSIVCWHLD
jgi:hypothetical protein